MLILSDFGLFENEIANGTRVILLKIRHIALEMRQKSARKAKTYLFHWQNLL